MHTPNQNQNPHTNAPVGQGFAPREVEAINGYYKKVVLEPTEVADEDAMADMGGEEMAPSKPAGIMVTHRDGTKAPYNADKINQAIERAARGLTDPVGKVAQIATETELAIFDGISTHELDQAVIQTAVQNIKDDPEFDVIATRLLLKTIYKQALGDYGNEYELEQIYRKKFAEYVQVGVEQTLLDPKMAELFDLEELGQSLDPARDNLLKYISLTVMQKRYMLKRRDQRPLEVPQYFWMRVAMGLSYNEKNPTQAAKMFYNKMSNLEYVPGGSTNVNAGTPHPTLSNCYLMEMQDDIDHIGKTVADVMKLSKATGGIGLGVTKLRGEGSPIRSNNTFSSGPIPFMHTIDSTLRAVSRAGKKMGALCFYMENWHINFPEFIDLRQNAGDEYRRTRTANTAAYMSDEFMKRVKENADWYLFDPFEVPDLNELYGEAFSKRYNEYIAKAEAGELKLFRKVKAREQFRSIIISVQTTAHPWLTWKDTINVRALNNNTGTIHLSNLCTEITLPQDRENVAVCNLTSINLSRHVVNRDIDWPRLEKSVRTAVRQLDNLVDINRNPITEAVHSDEQNRAVGLGLMGFTDVIERFGVAYDSQESYALMDQVMEFISYMAIDESAELARERGSYPNYEGSGWSKGWVPYDTIEQLQKERGDQVTVERGQQLSLEASAQRLDWDALREKVKGGMRNATLMAVAPTANIGLVAGTTPGMDPQFAQMFSRTTNAGKFLELNHNLVNELKKRDLWESCKDEIIARYGDLSEIDTIPEEVKAVYKTSFQIDPAAFVEVASRAQKWIDQAISRNMYLATRDVEETMNIYINAWEKGLKTTYYLHLQPRHQAEQSTTKVNKSASMGRGGFGSFVQQQKGTQTQQQTPSVEVSKGIPASPAGGLESGNSGVGVQTAPASGGFGAVAQEPVKQAPAMPTPPPPAGFGTTVEKHQTPSSKNQENFKSQISNPASAGFGVVQAQTQGAAQKETSQIPQFPNSTSPAHQEPQASTNTETASSEHKAGIPSWVIPPKPGKPVLDNSDENVMVEAKGFAGMIKQSQSSPRNDGNDPTPPPAPPVAPTQPKPTAGPSVHPDACPVDPMERLKCDSCQ